MDPKPVRQESVAFRCDRAVKAGLQQVAREFGVPVSALVYAVMEQFYKNSQAAPGAVAASSPEVPGTAATFRPAVQGDICPGNLAPRSTENPAHSREHPRLDCSACRRFLGLPPLPPRPCPCGCDDLPLPVGGPRRYRRMTGRDAATVLEARIAQQLAIEEKYGLLD